MKIARVVYSLALCLLCSTAAFANPAPKPGEIARQFAAKLNASGMHNKQIRPGITFINAESSGVYLIVNGQLNKRSFSESGITPQVNKIMQAVAIHEMCGNPYMRSLLETGVILRSNYKMENSSKIVMQTDVFQKNCKEKNNEEYKNKLLHDYLVANLSMQNKHIPKALEEDPGPIMSSDVVGTILVQKILVTNKNMLADIHDQHKMSVIKKMLCTSVGKSAITDMGGSVVYSLYSSPEKKELDLVINNATCNAAP